MAEHAISVKPPTAAAAPNGEPTLRAEAVHPVVVRPFGTRGHFAIFVKCVKALMVICTVS